MRLPASWWFCMLLRRTIFESELLFKVLAFRRLLYAREDLDAEPTILGSSQERSRGPRVVKALWRHDRSKRHSFDCWPPNS